MEKYLYLYILEMINDGKSTDQISVELNTDSFFEASNLIGYLKQKEFINYENLEKDTKIKLTQEGKNIILKINKLTKTDIDSLSKKILLSLKEKNKTSEELINEMNDDKNEIFIRLSSLSKTGFIFSQIKSNEDSFKITEKGKIVITEKIKENLKEEKTKKNLDFYLKISIGLNIFFILVIFILFLIILFLLFF